MDPRGRIGPLLPANHRNTARLFKDDLRSFGIPRFKESYSSENGTSMFPFEQKR